jgi:hypothetical protein
VYAVYAARRSAYHPASLTGTPTAIHDPLRISMLVAPASGESARRPAHRLQKHIKSPSVVPCRCIVALAAAAAIRSVTVPRPHHRRMCVSVAVDPLFEAAFLPEIMQWQDAPSEVSVCHRYAIKQPPRLANHHIQKLPSALPRPGVAGPSDCLLVADTTGYHRNVASKVSPVFQHCMISSGVGCGCASCACRPVCGPMSLALHVVRSHPRH